MKRTIIIIVVIIAVIVIAGALIWRSASNSPIYIDDNEDVATTTAPIEADMIKVMSPLPQSEVTSPLIVRGQARGGWYFEASAPIELRDANDKLLAQSYVQAQGEWMTNDFVPFEGKLIFAQPTTATGVLILMNDNPSGLPENQKEVRVPVKFALNANNTTNITLYYPNNKSGADICSTAAMKPLIKSIPKSVTPIQDSIQFLISYRLTMEERNLGFESEFPNDSFQLKGANLKDGVLTLEFNEVPGFTSGGACRVTTLANQITMTAKQFPSVKSVVFKPATLFQP